MKQTKIAILYICSGKYSIFWDDFYASCEEHFLKDAEKSYFVFSDRNFLMQESKQRVFFNEIPLEPWPFPTLNRYKYFSQIIDRLRGFDYVFFFNSNLKVLSAIGQEVLPIAQSYVFVQHPFTYNINNLEFGYDRNPESKAYIPHGEGKIYIAGGLNGGKASKFCDLILEIDSWTKDDLSRNVIAQWHDESHINKFYYLHEDALILHPGYLYPEGTDIPFEKKVLVKNKERHGGFSYLRNQESRTKKVLKQLKGSLKNIIRHSFNIRVN